jgi:glycosyltransferase involved in cell wall biosynthesis
LKVLFAVPGYKPAWRLGGPIHSVSALAENLVRRGHQVTVITTNSNLDQDLEVDTSRYHDVDGVQVRYFEHQEPLKRWLSEVEYFSKSVGFLYAPHMRAELDRLVPGMDIVHAHLPFVYPTLAAGRAAVRHGKPLVYHQRGVFDQARLRFRSLKKLAYLHAFELPTLRKAALLVALTEAETRSYARLGLRAPCRVIPNGIDVDSFSELVDASQLSPLGIQAEDVVVLFMGRIHPIKGTDRLLEAFLRVHAMHPSAKLVLAGPDEFSLEESFRMRADAAGLAGHVIFPGMVEGQIKTQLLARADLFALPSDAEGFSMAILEALAASTAVLMSPGCHFPEAERAGAAVVVNADPASLASALQGLLGDRARLRRMGEAGRRLVLQDYTWSRVTDQMLDAYESLIRP